ncbi:MAG TPA: type II toxin-antitoxin system VapC family toxin [Geminicoccaceae bacterium]|nr:type II toxin-antitoxin system VapC family toxin [Geminicoccaceae bacterium]
MSFAVDASALLAVFNRERGVEVVAPLLPGAAISAVNLSEAITKLIERGMPEGEIRALVGRTTLQIHPFDAPAAFEAAALRPPTRALGLSFADRACLALARSLALPALTGDRTWAKLELGIEIRVFR